MHARHPGRTVLIGLALLVLGLAGCVTPPSQREGAVERLLGRINEGGVEERIALSALPFVLDREIIIVERDLRTLWVNLTDVGFALTDPEVVSLKYGQESLYRAFGETMDMEVYFDRYAPEDVSVATVEAQEGTFLLILGERDRLAPVLHGIKGPLQ
ncbi:MAG: hypothetical protein ACOCYC_02110 [bacterium]